MEDSDDFWATYGDAAIVLMLPHGNKGREMMTLEDLYQQFRERMEREATSPASRRQLGQPHTPQT